MTILEREQILPNYARRSGTLRAKDGHIADDANYEGAYDTIIEIARKAIT